MSIHVRTEIVENALLCNALGIHWLDHLGHVMQLSFEKYVVKIKEICDLFLKDSGAVEAGVQGALLRTHF